MYIRRFIITLSVGCMILGTITQGVCADWKLFYQVDEGLKYFFDKESVVQPQKGIVQVWFKATLEQDGSEEGEQIRNQIEINCKSKSYRVLEESESSDVESAEKIKKSSTDQASRRLSLESVMGSLWANVCPDR